MGSHTLDERRDTAKSYVVASFEDTHHAALTILISKPLKMLSQPFIVKFINRRILLSVDMIVLVGIKSRRNEKKIRFEFHDALKHLGAEVLPPIRRGSIPRLHWNVEDSSKVRLVVSFGILVN